ncbi:MAG TPA: S9 family peptidase [Gemmatimonadaceae bacterium]|jgi:dipeptidyl-peptidase-4|nr:S9 family peptidase [Gemmatimonadaceae bacterium]
MRLAPRHLAVLAAAAVSVASPLQAQTPDRLTIDRIFASGDFRSDPLPAVVWMNDGRSYLDLRPDPAGGTDLVRVDLVNGTERVLADAAQLVDASGKRIAVEDVALSADESKALLFSNSVRVWRSNTRGLYHVLDLKTSKVTPIARAQAASPADTTEQPTLASTPSYVLERIKDPTLQMFAKFSPDGRRVAFVRGNNLWVTDLATGTETALTTDGSPNIINGTTDWVYEEELGIRDAFRWSPDSRRLAYWRFDQSAVPAFPMVDEMPLYPTVETLRYPKAGEPNSRVQLGVVDAAGGTTRWMDVGGDTGSYVARVEWLGADSITVQRLPRKQNRMDLLMLSAESGKGRVVTTDTDSAYVDVMEPRWIGGGKQFVMLSDRSGWRQAWLFGRDGKAVRQLTRDGVDVLDIVAVDEARGDLYVQAAAPSPTQRQLFRVKLDGSGAPRQVTRAPGSHNVSVGPGARFAVDVHTTASQPATVTLYELPAMTQRRVLVSNERLRRTLGALTVRAPEFFKLPMPDGTQLDAYRIVPANFDASKRYPVLMYVYGGPASPTVNDSWGGARYLWHQLLAQEGYVVVSVDNRGAAWRGRDFRKVTQYQLGKYEARDQIDAAKWLATQPWVDGGRIGIWGWSYGGYMTSLSTALGGDVFRAGIAVAPVTNWRLYDTIYTERFLWLPSENAAGYDQGSPQSHVAGLTARFLIVHGTGDDNVHPQNTMQYAEKLTEANKPFYMLMYPNRTHSISGGNAQAHLFGMLTKFVKDNL